MKNYETVMLQMSSNMDIARIDKLYNNLFLSREFKRNKNNKNIDANLSLNSSFLL